MRLTSFSAMILAVTLLIINGESNSSHLDMQEKIHFPVADILDEPLLDSCLLAIFGSMRKGYIVSCLKSALYLCRMQTRV